MAASSIDQIWKQPKCPLKGGGQPHHGASSPQVGFGGTAAALWMLLPGRATPTKSHTDWMIPFLWQNDKIRETETVLVVVRG